MGIGAAVVLLSFLGALAVAIGVLMLVVFAQIIGWRGLSRAYPAPHVGHAPWTRSDGVVLGAWGFNAPPLRVALDEAGVWLAPRAPFGVAFGAVRLPWEAITSVEPRHFMLFDVVELRYGEGPQATIGFVAGVAADAIASRAVERGATPLPALGDSGSGS